MIKSKFKKSTLFTVALLTAASFSFNSYAKGPKWLGDYLQPLEGADTVVTTYSSKSKVQGSLRTDANGNLLMDANGNFFFDYEGDTFYPITSPDSGKLVATAGPIGTVSGTALFPYEFAEAAFGAYAFWKGLGPMPAMPPVINWTMDNITINHAGTTYAPLGDVSYPTSEMGLAGRAFTGLGPAEMGQLQVGVDNDDEDISMSVRMGGCFAVAATEGEEAGKIGTYCLNSTFTFDLSGINLENPLASTITGLGTSNCTTVLHTPMQMP